MQLLTKLPAAGKVTAILHRQSREAGFVKAAVDKMVLTIDGPENDCHSGPTRKSDSRTLQLYPRNLDIRNVRQITIVSEEELAEVAAVLGVPKIEASWFGANLVMSGIADLTLLLPSTRFQFPSGAVLVADMENMPCGQIAKVVAEHYPDIQFKVVKAATHKRGLTAWVEFGGEIATGDEVKVWLPPNRLYPHMPEIK